MLRESNECVFHITDDVLPIAQTALGYPHDLTTSQNESGAWIINEACSYFQLAIDTWDTEDLRSQARARLLKQQHLRPFWGWNRAKHAVLEATILATRLHLLTEQIIRPQLLNLENCIEKTAGKREREAWDLVISYIAEKL